MERVYARTFADFGLLATEAEVHRSVHDTWRNVAARRAAGGERYAAGGGERAFWEGFVGEIWAGVGGGRIPKGLLPRLVAHFQGEKHWKVYDDVYETLRVLRARGLRLAIVSNWDSSLPRLLRTLGLDESFEAVLVSALVGASKPDRLIFEAALRVLDIRPDEALHVGDSDHDDYHGARNAGIPALLLDRQRRASAGVEAIASLTEVAARIP